MVVKVNASNFTEFLAQYESLTVVHTKDLPRTDWLTWRKKGLGGSEIAAILGKSPYESALAVYLGKLDLIPPKEENDAMHFGNLLEPVVAGEFERRSGFTAYELHRMVRHPIYDFMVANVDRIIYDDVLGWGILECKTASTYKEQDWLYDKTPEHYYYQVQFYLAVTGLQFAYIACLIGGQKFVYNFIARDETAIEQILEGATDFWFNHLLEKVPPDVSHLDTDALGRLYPKHEEGKTLNITEEEAWIWDDLILARKALSGAEKAEAEASNRIKARMGDAEILYLGGEKIATWKTNAKGSRVFKPNLPKEE